MVEACASALCQAQEGHARRNGKGAQSCWPDECSAKEFVTFGALGEQRNLLVPERLFMLRLLRSDLTRQISFGFLLGAAALYASTPSAARSDLNARVYAAVALF